MKKNSIMLTIAILIASLLVSCNSSAPPAAASYTVKFMAGDKLYFSQTVTDGGTITEPSTEPTAEGYIFGGWCREGANSEDGKWEFETNTVSQDITLCAIWLKLNPVGGRVFYVRDNDNGLEYKFYTADKIELTDITVEGLADAKYYTAKGLKSPDDKFFVYDNGTRNENNSEYPETVYAEGGLAAGKYWGWFLDECGSYNVEIGGGRNNTNKILFDWGVPTDYEPNIWGYVKACRANMISGCNDWYIPSTQELDKLRESGLEPDWFSSKYIWSSVEESFATAFFWNDSFVPTQWDFEDWDSDWKCDTSDPKCVVAIRSF